MGLDVEKCSVEKQSETGEKESSTCCNKIEYCIYIAIILCLLFLITLQMFSPSLTVLLVTDPSLVVTINDKQASETYKTLTQDVHFYELDSQKAHLIEARFVNSSKERIFKVDLRIEEERMPFLKWFGSLFEGIHL